MSLRIRPVISRSLLPVCYAGGSIAAALIGCNYFSFRAGESNRPPLDGVVWVVVIGVLGGVLAMTALMVGLTRLARWRLGQCLAWLGLMALPVAIGLLANRCTGGLNGVQAYEAGFRRWTRSHVDEIAIRSWLRSRPPATQSSAVPSLVWPAALSQLHPVTVNTLPDSRGILITWGEFGGFGTQRQVYVCLDPSLEPDRMRWGADLPKVGPGTDYPTSPWRQVRPGLYAFTLPHP